jgi:hypothetical protein
MNLDLACDASRQQALVHDSIAVIIDAVTYFERRRALERHTTFGRAFGRSGRSALGRALHQLAERALHLRPIVRDAATVIVYVVTDLRRGRAHIGGVIIAIGGIRDVALRPKTRLLVDIGISEAVLVEVQVPGDELGIVVHHAIAIIIDVVTLLRRLRMHVRIAIVTVLGNLRKPGAFTPSAQLGRVPKTVAIDVAIERRRLGAALALDRDACIFDKDASRRTGSRITAHHTKTRQAQRDPSNLTSHFHD